MKWYLAIRFGTASIQTLEFDSPEAAEAHLDGMRQFMLFGVTLVKIVDEEGLGRLYVEEKIQE